MGCVHMEATYSPWGCSPGAIYFFFLLRQYLSFAWDFQFVYASWPASPKKICLFYPSAWIISTYYYTQHLCTVLRKESSFPSHLSSPAYTLLTVLDLLSSRKRVSAVGVLRRLLSEIFIFI